MIGAAALFVFTGIASGHQDALITAILIGILPSGGGVVAIVMAIIRWRWFRAVRRRGSRPEQ